LGRRERTGGREKDSGETGGERGTQQSAREEREREFWIGEQGRGNREGQKT